MVLAASGCGRIAFDPLATSSESDAAADDAADDAAIVRIAPAFVQKRDTSPGAVQAPTLTLPNDVTAGDLIIVVVDVTVPLPALVSVTDTVGSAYVVVETPAPSWRTFLAYGVAGASGPATITATMSATPTASFNVRAFEYTNVAQTSVISQVAGDTGTLIGADATQTTILTTEPNQMIFAFATFRGAAGQTGTGYTVRSTFDGDIVEDRIVATPGQTTASATPRPATSGWAIGALAIRGR